MKNIDNAVQAVLIMDEQLRKDLLIKDGVLQVKKLWENTYIKKQIDRRENNDAFTLQDHIRAMIYSMLTSGAKWERMEPSTSIETGQIGLIDEIFFQYDVKSILNASPSSLSAEIKQKKLGTQYLDKQMNALVNVNIPKMLSIEKEHGSLDTFYQTYIEKDPTMKLLLKTLSNETSPNKYVQMDVPLNAEYLRNVGYDISKPDRHICRILSRGYLDCSEYEDINKNEIARRYEALDIVTAIAEKAGKHIAETDYILWSFCADGYGQICTVSNPKCNVCSAIHYCKKKE